MKCKGRRIVSYESALTLSIAGINVELVGMSPMPLPVRSRRRDDALWHDLFAAAGQRSQARNLQELGVYSVMVPAPFYLYIHAHPLKAGLVASPAQWPFSNSQEWVETRSRMAWS